MISKKCKTHIDNAGMTRWQHFKFAIGFAYELKKAAWAVAVHAVAPRYFETYGSDKIKELHKKIKKLEKK
tara:strand:- start:22 stop:231 length:210 start_codon:yes stop_codon:yes gene_type:complete